MRLLCGCLSRVPQCRRAGRAGGRNKLQAKASIAVFLYMLGPLAAPHQTQWLGHLRWAGPALRACPRARSGGALLAI